jgi:peptidoglycan/LPS O-acetylase OafA/YrhL
MTTTGEPRDAVDRTLPPPADRAPTITALTGIRALAAAWVVFFHFRDPVLDLLPGLRFLLPAARAGYLGVDVFFVLSGFVIAHNYAQRVGSRPAYLGYLWARGARVYPVHLVTTLLMALLAVPYPTEPGVQNATPTNIVANVFMLQALPGVRGVNVPSWSVCCEVAAYLVFPVLAWWALRRSARVAATWAVLVLGLGTVALAFLTQAGMSTRWPRICIEFTVGVLLWAWWRDRRRASARWDVAAIGCVLGVVALSYLTADVSFLAVPLLALFVVSCASVTGPVARLLGSRPMQWGGRVSYSLYLSHNLVFVVLRHLVPWTDYVDAALWLRSCVVAITALWIMGAAAGLYYGVEEPARRRLSRWWTDRTG